MYLSRELVLKTEQFCAQLSGQLWSECNSLTFKNLICEGFKMKDDDYEAID